MNNTVVIVTYEKETWFLEIQLRSIAKFLEPCNIVLVFCSAEGNFTKWKLFVETHFQSILPNHSLTILTAHDIYSRTSEVTWWQSFAYSLRILVADYIHTKDYWITDTKNFWFKPTTFDQMLEEYPRLYSVILSDASLSFLHNMYGIDATQFKRNITPFKFNTEIARFMVSEGISHDFFSHGTESFAEIFQYQAFCYKHNIDQSKGECETNNSTVFFDSQISNPYEIISRMKTTTDSIRVTGFAQEYITKQVLDEKTAKAIITAVGGRDILPQFSPRIKI